MSKFLNYAIGGGVAVLATGVIAYSIADGNVARVDSELRAQIEARNETARDWAAEQQAALDAQMAEAEQATEEAEQATEEVAAEAEAATEEVAAEAEEVAAEAEAATEEVAAEAEAATEEVAAEAEAATEEVAAEAEEAAAEAEAATEEVAADAEAATEEVAAAADTAAAEGETQTAEAEAAAEAEAPAEGETQMAAAGPDPELVAAGERVFRQCQACHQVGEDAQNRVGPKLVNVVGGPIAAVEDFKYSNVLAEAGQAGQVWDRETLTAFLANPRESFKGTKMSFRGLSDAEDIEAVIAYLQAEGGGGFEDANAGEATGTPAPEVEEASAPETPEMTEEAEQSASAAPAFEGTPSAGPMGLGRLATETEIAAWNIDVRFDGQGLPEGSGSVAEGEPIYQERCSVCHGTFGEAIGRWPVLAGGEGTLAADRPVKTIGSYWPYVSTVFDYVHRAMPFGDAQSLTDDEVYAVTAYLLNLNFLVDDDFVLSRDSFSEVAELPNQGEFFLDDREETEFALFAGEVCMENCKEGVEITRRAAVLDVTPEEAME